MVAYNWVKSSEMVDLKCIVNISETPIIFLGFSTRYTISLEFIGASLFNGVSLLDT